MIKRLSLLSAALVITGCSHFSQPDLPQGITLVEQHKVAAGEVGINYQKYTLDNGLTVLLHEDHSDPLVHVNVTYHVGSAREEAGKSGFAHFFEHMMFEGSQHAPVKLHWEVVNAAGGSMNGGTNRDTTRYYNHVPVSELEKVLWLEADRMGFLLPAVTQEKFEIQRDTVKNERAQRIDNRPYGRVGETISQALYPQGHPYSWPVIGWTEDLDRVDVNDLKAFFQTWYGPENAVLTIGGDIDVAATLRWVEQYFAAIPGGAAIPDAPPQPAKLTSDRYVTLEDKISLPLLQFSFPTVSAQHPDEAPLDMLAETLGQGKSSFFYKTFVESGLAVNVGVSHPCSELACNFNVYLVASPTSSKNLTELAKMVEGKLASFANIGVTESVLQHSKNAFRADSIFSLESVSGKVGQLAINETFFGTPDTIAYDLKRYGDVTLADVERVYHQYLHAKPKVVASVVPEGMASAAAYEANYALPAPLKSDGKSAEVTPWHAPDEPFDRSNIPTSSPQPAIAVPQLEQATLKNGIPVVATYSDENPTISLLITLEGDASLFPADKIGVARLTAGMLAEASTEHSAAELTEQLKALGSSIHFSASDVDSYIEVFCLVDALDDTLTILQERLFKPAFDADAFARIKQNQLHFIENNKNYPSSLAGQASNQLRWGKDSRYSVASSGSLQTVKSITLDDVKQFYQAAYTPKAASFVAVGALPMPELIQKLSVFEPWQGQTIRQTKMPEPITAERVGSIYLVDKPGAAQGVVRIIGELPAYDATGEHFKTRLANFSLGGYFGSRLNQTLRQERGYTYGAHSSVYGDKTLGHFTFSSDIRGDVVGPAVAEAITIMHRYQLNGPSEEEIANMRSAAAQKEALKYETPNQKARLLQLIQFYGLDTDYTQQQMTIIESISQQELTQLAQKHMDPKQMFVVVVGDAATIRPQLEANLDWPVIDWTL